MQVILQSQTDVKLQAAKIVQHTTCYRQLWKSRYETNDSFVKWSRIADMTAKDVIGRFSGICKADDFELFTPGKMVASFEFSQTSREQ